MLNRKRYEEEVAQGLHGGTTTRTSRRACSVQSVQPSLDFEKGPAPTSRHASPSAAILDYLRTNPGWHAKSDVLAATGITNGQWNSAIAELLADGRVERQGERRGARYRAKD